MEKRRQKRWLVSSFLLIVTAVSAMGIRSVSAADDQPSGPDRFAVVKEEYVSYEWWLASWADNKIACSIIIDHDGMPTGGEIFSVCGASLYDKWIATKTCETAEGNPSLCMGYYLVSYKAETAFRDIGVALPPPVVWVSLDGCIQYKSTFRCDPFPTLILSGEEPLEGERITALNGSLDGMEFNCDPVCYVDLVPTDEDGLNLEFWAISSYGDTSVRFDAHVRVAKSDDPAQPYWFVDVLSAQWRGTPLAACSQIWGIFPPVGGAPAWLLTPPNPEDLSTVIPYEYLAANLIQQEVADASICSDGGLLENGLISPCGLEAARSMVVDWQNRFDGLIFTAAQEVGIPAQLLKSLFSRESQFWPAKTNGHPEAGLGQLTNGGADTALLWNRPFYEQFCSTLLDGAICRRGYAHLKSEQKDILRHALVENVNAFCPECEMGIDLERAEKSVTIFAETLLASCDQTRMVVDLNYSQSLAETSVTYDDLWRFTLVNYNAGPGCLGLAIDETSNQGEPLSWEYVSTHLTPVCQGAFDYVNDISNVSP